MEKIRFCSNFNCQKSIEEVINASEKHRQVAVELKEITEQQKKKLKEYREMNIRLYDDISDLESDIKEKDEFTNKLMKKRNDLESEVKHLVEKVELKNEDILNMEIISNEQKDISMKFVKDLEEENKSLKKHLEAVQEEFAKMSSEMKIKFAKEETKEGQLMAEIKYLEEEISILHQNNVEKEILLKNFEEEKKTLDEEIHTLKSKGEVHKPDDNTAKSLEEELNLCGETKLLKSFQCNYCNLQFLQKTPLKKHVRNVHVLGAKMELLNLEKKVLDQSVEFTTSIHKLMKLENSDLKQPCLCKGRICSISHMKHNWIKSVSDRFIEKFNEIKTGESENGEVIEVIEVEKNSHAGFQGGVL